MRLFQRLALEKKSTRYKIRNRHRAKYNAKYVLSLKSLESNNGIFYAIHILVLKSTFNTL